jgi:hypothetical protein
VLLVEWIIPFDARNYTEVLVDGTNVVVRQLFEIWPRHDLEKVTVERRGYAAGVRGSGTGRMAAIHIYAGPEDLQEL